MFGQHLVDCLGQATPDPSHTEIGEIVQTLVPQCPSCGPGHMTRMQCRIRMIRGCRSRKIEKLAFPSNDKEVTKPELIIAQHKPFNSYYCYSHIEANYPDFEVHKEGFPVQAAVDYLTLISDKPYCNVYGCQQ